MHIIAVVISVLIISLLNGSQSYANEVQQRKQVRQLALSLLARQLSPAEIEQRTRPFWEQQARTGSGIWKLSSLHWSLRLEFNNIVRHGSSQELRQTESILQQWIKAYPESPTAHLAYAQLLLAQDKHTLRHALIPRNLRQWLPGSYRAQAYWQTNKRITSQSPYGYELMLQLADYQGWSQQDYEQLLDQAIQRFPYYYPLYFRSMDYYRSISRSPLTLWGIKLGGDKRRQLLEQLQSKAYAATQEKDQYGIYARLYWYAWQSNYFGRQANWQVDWPKMSQGIDAVLAQYPNQWNIQHFAKFACDIGDMQKTSELWGRISGYPVLQAWDDDPELFEWCKQKVLDSASTVSMSYQQRLQRVTQLIGNTKGDVYELKTALADTQILLQGNPGDANAQLQLAKLYMLGAAGDGQERRKPGWDEVGKHLDDVIRQQPDNDEAYSWRAYWHSQRKSQDSDWLSKARADLEQAYQLKTQHPLYYQTIAELLIESKQPAQAEAYFQRAFYSQVKMDIIEIMAFRQLERYYRTQGPAKWADWEKLHQTRITEYPNSAPYHLSYAQFLICDKGSADAAQSMLEQSSQLSMGEQISSLDRQIHMLRGTIAYYRWAQAYQQHQDPQEKLWRAAQLTVPEAAAITAMLPVCPNASLIQQQLQRAKIIDD